MPTTRPYKDTTRSATITFRELCNDEACRAFQACWERLERHQQEFLVHMASHPDEPLSPGQERYARDMVAKAKINLMLDQGGYMFPPSLRVMFNDPLDDLLMA